MTPLWVILRRPSTWIENTVFTWNFQMITLLSASLRAVKIILYKEHPKMPVASNNKGSYFAHVTHSSQGSREALLTLITLVLQAPPYQTFPVTMPREESALENIILPFKYSSVFNWFIGQRQRHGPFPPWGREGVPWAQRTGILFD